MLVRRTYLNHRNVTPECSAAVEFLRLAEEYRDVVGISGLHALADIGSYKESLVEEDSFEFRVCIRSRSFGMEVVDAYILKFSCLSSLAECVDQYAGSACDAAKMNVVA